MKIGPSITAGQRRANLLDADKSKYDKALLDKLLPSLNVHEQSLIRNHQIRKIRHTDKMVSFEAIVPVKQAGFMEYEEALYWYRTMSREDYLFLANNNMIDLSREKDYGGIAPNYSYVSQPKYYGNAKSGTHIVEFKLPVKGSAFMEEINQREREKKKNKFRPEQPKGEGGGSIGLGQSGMYKGTAGEIFNEKLLARKIDWRLVAFKCDNVLPKHEFYY